MPYISGQARVNLARGKEPSSPGELNYLITKLILNYFSNSPKDYQSINDILGALTGVQLEFYRRVATPYENEKIEKNGDVFI